MMNQFSQYFSTPYSPALQCFLDSMQIDYYKWHDGIGYDLEALKTMEWDELQQVEKLMISRKDNDWREVEVLAAIASPACIRALKECLCSTNMDVKLFAARYLMEMKAVNSIEDIIIDTLPETKIGYGLSFALNLAKTYPSTRVKKALFQCALNGNDDIRVHCAALLFYLYGLSSSEFDMEHRMLFLNLKTKDMSERKKAFAEFCRILRVDPVQILQ